MTVLCLMMRIGHRILPWLVKLIKKIFIFISLCQYNQYFYNKDKGIIFTQLKGREMITTEFVMAVLCAPLSGRELLNAERSNNVKILRRLEYDYFLDYFRKDGLLADLASFPLKLMFIFGQGDAIVVSSTEDKLEVQRRLHIA